MPEGTCELVDPQAEAPRQAPQMNQVPVVFDRRLRIAREYSLDDRRHEPGADT